MKYLMVFLCLLSIGGILASIIALIIQLIRKKSIKPWIISLPVCIVVFIASLMTLGATQLKIEEKDFPIQKIDEQEKKEINNIAEYEDTRLEITGAEFKTNENNERTIIISATYTNFSEIPNYVYSAFGIRAFQNNVEIEEITLNNDEDTNITVEIKNGASIDVKYIFKLTDNSPVEFEVITPTASEEVLAKVIYSE